VSQGIRVTRDPLFKGTISPFIYGEFVEFLNDLIPGMWAERIRDRSFEGLTMPRMFYRKERDFPKPAWCELKIVNAPFGRFTVHDITDVVFDRDPSSPFVGKQSARVRVSGTRNFLAGISQENVAVRKGEKLRLELFLRGENLGGKVHVFIGREYGAYPDFYDKAEFDNVGGEWRRFEAELRSPVTDTQALFAIMLDRPGTLWIDKVSLMPEDNMGGWRRDVVEAVKASKPGIIRFGGSSLIFYDWRTGIGPREKRAPFINTPWNNTEENDVGLDEFLHFCELVDAEALICVNSNSSTPEEIAAQVEYTNGPVYSKWGSVRAANGHPEPYNVKYWQIGNEQRGEGYESVLLDYVKAMKEVDPSIKLLAAYPSENIVKNLSTDIDFVCPHFYEPDVKAHQDYTEKMRGRIGDSRLNREMKLGITEWSHTAGDWGDSRAWLQTLYNGLFVARMLNHYQRNGDIICIANRSNLVNSCFSGSIQTNSLDLYFTPAHIVQKLYSTMSGNVAVRVECGVEQLDVSGTMDENGTRMMIWVVNPAETRVETDVVFDGVGVPKSAKAVTVSGPSENAVNSFERKDNVAPVEQSIEPARELKWRFPPFSLTGFELRF
jgi:alpha-N-arabinofuranosidase